MCALGVCCVPPSRRYAAEDHVLMANCTFDHCQLNGVKWPFAVLRQARGSNVASWQSKIGASEMFFGRRLDILMMPSAKVAWGGHFEVLCWFFGGVKWWVSTRGSFYSINRKVTEMEAENHPEKKRRIIWAMKNPTVIYIYPGSPKTYIR